MSAGKCTHFDPDAVEIESVTPASGPWGYATLYADDDYVELTVSTIAAWALVSRDVSECSCPERAVVPLTAGNTFLIPALDEPLGVYGEANRYSTDSRIVEPGLRPIVERDQHGYHMRLVPGTWTPGIQDVDADTRRSAAE